VNLDEDIDDSNLGFVGSLGLVVDDVEADVVVGTVVVVVDVILFAIIELI